MAKQFTKVTKTYATKNKLQLMILKELEQIDGTLFQDKTDASKHIKKLYQNALNNYKGIAVIPKLDFFKALKGDLTLHVEDVIHISIYNVENDLS